MSFPGVVANDEVDFEIQAGEIRALVGENGAGKTTLMRTLYGMYRNLTRGKSLSRANGSRSGAPTRRSVSASG